MSYTLTYGSWFRYRKKINRITSSEEALKKHIDRSLYYVVVSEGEKPYCFLEINNTFFNIGFLDDLNREYLRYQFKEVEPNKLFMVESQYWDYEEDTDEKIRTTMFFFKQDGSIYVNETDLITNEEEESYSDIDDISKLYESYPEFGHYEALIKKER